ncbi:hypothetical protein PHLCEN_2v624 [Hermanssonia centrifuga]|uniref:Uncharacterized protein n=1 Tax=Hermanssonia centrifuga TaxID=98765 RepID=A0A2R6S5F4_9APHY|nr:hypothetical protein PHLCEN_2v624 [Hermanssonia centrifuga]
MSIWNRRSFRCKETTNKGQIIACGGLFLVSMDKGPNGYKASPAPTESSSQTIIPSTPSDLSSTPLQELSLASSFPAQSLFSASQTPLSSASSADLILVPAQITPSPLVANPSQISTPGIEAAGTTTQPSSGTLFTVPPGDLPGDSKIVSGSSASIIAPHPTSQDDSSASTQRVAISATDATITTSVNTTLRISYVTTVGVTQSVLSQSIPQQYPLKTLVGIGFAVGAVLVIVSLAITIYFCKIRPSRRYRESNRTSRLLSRATWRFPATGNVAETGPTLERETTDTDNINFEDSDEKSHRDSTDDISTVSSISQGFSHRASYAETNFPDVEFANSDSTESLTKIHDRLGTASIPTLSHCSQQSDMHRSRRSTPINMSEGSRMQDRRYAIDGGVSLAGWRTEHTGVEGESRETGRETSSSLSQSDCTLPPPYGDFI